MNISVLFIKQAWAGQDLVLGQVSKPVTATGMDEPHYFCISM